MKKTPLYGKHVSLDAKLVDFAGYKMPIQYLGISKEHNAVRQSAGIFDVSHMGEIIISGPGAESYLNFIMTNDVSSLEAWQVQYSAMCFEDGGVVDDLLIYRYPEYFMLVVNCSNLEKNFDWLMAHKRDDVNIIDLSEKIGLIALQGPKSRQIIDPLVDININKMNYYRFAVAAIDGLPCTLARTGYTGELGFEIYADNENIVRIWDKLINKASAPIMPVGLGCRDTLRLEMKYPLYGNDIDDRTNPIEAGLGWIAKLDKKDDFIGKEALLSLNGACDRSLVCIQMIDRGIPRKGYKLLKNNSIVGQVTSGTQSPSLKIGIGLAYVTNDFAQSGTNLSLLVRDKELKCKIVDSPFYKKGTLKK